MYQVCKKSSARQRFFIFMSAAILLFTVACASNIVVSNPETLYQKAEKAYQGESYGRALDLFQTLQNEFPDTEYAKQALLRTADIAYSRKELEEAARAYNDFINFNPDHPKAPYAYYQVGMTYYVTLETIDLDLEALRQALETFQAALARYPSSPPYTAKILQRINDCKRRFAKREFYVGFYYFKQGKFHSAAGRFEYLLAHYPGFIDDKVLYYLGLAQLNRGNVKDGHRALLTLTKAFPESPFVAKARPWLEKDEGPGLPLMFMVKDYFWVKDYDIGDSYLTTSFAPENYSPRLFNMLSGQRNPAKPPQPKEVTFTSLYRPNAKQAEENPEKSRKTAVKKPAPDSVAESGRPNLEGAGVVAEESTSVAAPKPRSQARLGQADDPLEIISDWTEADRQKGTITFGGKVVAKQKDMVLYADRVINYFDMDNQKLIKAIAVGNVKLNQADKFVTCEKAELVQAERKITLTGNPVMWQGENRVSGERIIIYLNQSQAEVFGGKNGKAKVKIQQKE